MSERTCDDCNGSGVSHDLEWLDDELVRVCATCSGLGKVAFSSPSPIPQDKESAAPASTEREQP